MAYSKVLVLALALGLASSAPQNLVLRALNTDVPGQVQIVRAAPQVSTVAHHSTSPAVVRTVAQPAVTRTVAVAQPTIVAQPAVTRTVAVAQPAVTHLSHAVPAATAVRTVATEVVRDGEGFDPNPQYNFGYSITDAVTGDSKARQETRDGDVVSGSYSVADPDGRIRTVQYTADDVNGFQASVTYDGQEGPVAIPINAPATATVVDTGAAVVDARNIVAQAAVPAVTRTVVAQPAAAHIVAQPAITRTVAHHTATPVVTRTVAQPSVVSHVHAAPAVRTVTQHAAVPTVVQHSPAVRTVVAAQPAAVSVANPIAGLTNTQLRSLLSGFGVQTIA